MRAFLFLFLLLTNNAWAARSVSYIRAQNFLLSSADSAAAWLLPLAPISRQRWHLTIQASAQPGVFGLYSDIKSKNDSTISQRLSASYGNVYDAAVKIGLGARFGNFEQSFFVTEAASLLVNDPVFPDLTGVLFNDYAFNSRYAFSWAGIYWRPALTYGLRRVSNQSFTVGQLLDAKPQLALKNYPYRAFADFAFRAQKLFSWGEIGVEGKGIPLLSQEYLYWQVEVVGRSRNLFEGVKRTWPWRANLWASAAPLRGADYSLVRSVKLGTTVEWFRYFQSDLFLMDKFRPAALLRFGTAAWSLEAFTFARSEDDFLLYSSRQYGIALHGAF